MSQITNTNIIIVGAGPIGLSMCRALKDTGLQVHLIEKQTQAQIANPKPDGREIAITHRTKNFMQKLGQWQYINPSALHFLRRAEVFNGQSGFALGFDVPKNTYNESGQTLETLGYLLSNHYIRKSIYDAVFNDETTQSYLTTSFNQHIEKISTQADFAEVQFSDGQKIKGDLIIAADSRTSFMRKALGIGADMQDFGRTVLLFRCKHTFSNKETAHEWFYYGKTLAVLPLNEYESSMVITIENSRVDWLKAMHKEQLATEMMTWLNGSLGEMTVSSDMYSYPLLGVHADKFYATRSALIGDAAVGMHPVTAHGYNLGMESVEILNKLIAQAVFMGRDIGNPSLLKAYHRKHSIKTRLLYHGTNTIVKLYTDDSPPAKMARHFGLRFGQSFKPIKKLITAQLTGYNLTN